MKPAGALAFALLACGGVLPATGHAAKPAPRAPAPLAASADEVIARNAAARGGLEAWRRVQTMAWLGHVERADANAAPMRFVMQLQRPNLTRFDIRGATGQFTRVFDGTAGWKLRPTAEGPGDLKPFSAEEAAFARDEFVIDGPLIDAQAKGVVVHLDGIDMLDGRRTYRLSLKLPRGAERTLWIDAATNLDVRYDRPATNPLQPGARVSVYYRDWGTFDGLRLPRSVEVSAAKGRSATDHPDRLVIDQVHVNPPIPPDEFVRPATPAARKASGVVRAEPAISDAPRVGAAVAVPATTGERP